MVNQGVCRGDRGRSRTCFALLLLEQRAKGWAVRRACRRARRRARARAAVALAVGPSRA